MQGREAGVGPTALELDEQSFLRWAGEIPGTFEGAVGAAGALFFLEESSTSCDGITAGLSLQHNALAKTTSRKMGSECNKKRKS